MLGVDRLLVCFIVFSIPYHALHAMAASALQETMSNIEYKLPPANTLQESAQRKILAMLTSGDFGEGLKLAQYLQSSRMYGTKIKAAFINEHLIAFCELLHHKLTTHHLDYYTGEEGTGVPRSGTFVSDESSFVLLTWKRVIIADRELCCAALDLWMLTDLFDKDRRQKKPYKSKFISLGESEASAWIPAMHLKGRNPKPIDQTIFEERYNNTSTYKAYQQAVKASRRFLVRAPKMIQIWTISSEDDLIHEATLEIWAHQADISLSPDGTMVTIRPSWSEELFISLEKLSKVDEGDILKITTEKVFHLDNTGRVLSSEPLQNILIPFSVGGFAQWGHCGKYLASKRSGHEAITLCGMEEGIPVPLRSLLLPETFSQKIAFILSSRKKFIMYLSSQNDHPPLTLHLFDTEAERSECIYEDSCIDSTRQYQYHSMQLSNDERYCLISVSQNNSVLVDLMNKTSLVLDPKVHECDIQAHMNPITLNNAHISLSNRYIVSINSNVAQIICLQAPFSSLSLTELFLLQRILSADGVEAKKKVLAFLSSTIEAEKELEPVLKTMLSSFETEVSVPQH